jgi:hypothetical protein
MKINREILWKRHELVQSQLRQFEKWYDSTSTALMDLEEKRQAIVKRYFAFADGEIKVNKQGQYVPLLGANIANYDKEMEALMSGFEDIENFEFLRLI